VNGSNLKRVGGVNNEKCMMIDDPKMKIITAPVINALLLQFG
jgi:hypothetical protein